MNLLLVAIALLCLLLLIFIGIAERHRVKLAKQIAERENEVCSGDWIVSIINKEIAAPLSIVSGHLQIAVNDEDLPSSVRRDIQMAHDTTRQIEHFVGEIDALRTYSDEEFHPHMEPVQLDTLLSSIVEDKRNRAEKKGLKLTVQLSEEICDPVVADYSLLKQMVSSVLSNSINYTNEGEVSLSAHRHGEKTLITIKDTGVGIEEEMVQRFFYSDEVHPHLLNGHGALGILLVRKAAEHLGGKVTCKSVIKQGTEITLSLPFAVTEIHHKVEPIPEPEEEVSLDELV